jgi:hypothetical protein
MAKALDGAFLPRGGGVAEAVRDILGGGGSPSNAPLHYSPQNSSQNSSSSSATATRSSSWSSTVGSASAARRHAIVKKEGRFYRAKSDVDIHEVLGGLIPLQRLRHRKTRKHTHSSRFRHGVNNCYKGDGAPSHADSEDNFKQQENQPYGIPDTSMPSQWDVIGLGQAMVRSLLNLLFFAPFLVICRRIWREIGQRSCIGLGLCLFPFFMTLYTRLC